MIVAAITIILLIGIREGVWFNAVMVVIKLAVLCFFVIISWKAVHTGNWNPLMPNGMVGMISGAAVIFFAYIGFDAVSTVAEEAKNPQKDMPIGIIASLVICTVFYVVIAAVFTGIIPYKDLTQTLSSQRAEPLTMAMNYANIKGIALVIVAFGAVVANTAVLFVFQLGQPRIFFSMARDGLLPKMFSTVHPKYRTPWGSTILTGVAVGTFSMFSSLDDMVDLTNIGTLFAFILVCTGIIILRVKDPGRARPFRVPGGYLLPVLGILGCFLLIAYLPPTSWLRFAAWLNIGAVIYVCYGSVKSKLTGRAVAADPNEHDARTAYNGAWLGVVGILVLVVTRMADIHRLGDAAPAGIWLTSPLWTFTVPLLLNAFLLCPAVLLRANRALKSTISEAHRTRARTALFVGGLLMVAILIYLIAVWINR